MMNASLLPQYQKSNNLLGESENLNNQQMKTCYKLTAIEKQISR